MNSEQRRVNKNGSQVGNGNSRNVSCSKPSLHCCKRSWEGVLYKWLTKLASDAMHLALHK